MPDSQIPVEALEAAHEYDRRTRPPGGGWQRVGDAQLLRLLDGLATQGWYLIKPDELPPEEAEEIQDMATELYKAQDALDFVGECCDVADKRGGQITTDDVREWLKGARCGRQIMAERAEPDRVFAPGAGWIVPDREPPPPIEEDPVAIALGFVDPPERMSDELRARVERLKRHGQAVLDQDAMRQRYAGAIREHWLDDSNLDGSPSGSTFCVCGKWYELDKRTWDDHMADVVSAVRDEEIAALRQQVEQLSYERQLLGAARMTLDLVAAGDISRWDQVRQGAEDVAQRIVDEIGHSVTDEPALGPGFRAEIAALQAESAELGMQLMVQLDKTVEERARADKAEATVREMQAATRGSHADSPGHFQCVPMTRVAELIRDKLNAVGQREEAIQKAREALTMNGRVRELHEPVAYREKTACKHCSEHHYPDYEVLWPCPTIAALDGDADG